MGEFMRNHVLWIDFIQGGWQFSCSWGTFFGIPIALIGLWFFNHAARIWRNFTVKAARPVPAETAHDSA